MNLYWQRKPDYDVAPFWTANGLTDKPYYFRCFAFWDGEQVHVLPASLCTTVQPIQRQSYGIKDTWIPSVGPQEPASTAKLSIPEAGDDIALIEGLIPSRAAENLFWLGTGLERCENLVRLLRVYIDRFTEVAMYPDEGNSWSLQAFKRGIQEHRLVYPYQHQPMEQSANKPLSHKLVVWQCMTDLKTQGALSQAIAMVLSSATQVRELLSYDTLRIIDQLKSLQTDLNSLSKHAPLHLSQRLLDNIIAQVMAFNGSVTDSLSLGSGAFMMDMGRRLERSTQLVACFHTMLVDVPSNREHIGALDAVLLTQVSAVTHRRRYRIKHNVESGIELLLIDAHYPRSLAFQIEQMLALSEHLPSRKRQGFLNTPVKLLLQLKTHCALADPIALSKVSEQERREALDSFLTNIDENLNNFRERLQIRYFFPYPSCK